MCFLWQYMRTYWRINLCWQVWFWWFLIVSCFQAIIHHCCVMYPLRALNPPLPVGSRDLFVSKINDHHRASVLGQRDFARLCASFALARKFVSLARSSGRSIRERRRWEKTTTESCVDDEKRHFRNETRRHVVVSQRETSFVSLEAVARTKLRRKGWACFVVSWYVIIIKKKTARRTETQDDANPQGRTMLGSFSSE